MLMKNLFGFVRLSLALLVAAAPCLAGSVPTLDIEGSVVDDETGASIPYVNVGVPGAGVGTVGGEDGRFALSGVQPDAGVAFSAIGFADRHIRVDRPTYVESANFTVVTPEANGFSTASTSTISPKASSAPTFSSATSSSRPCRNAAR